MITARQRVPKQLQSKEKHGSISDFNMYMKKNIETMTLQEIISNKRMLSQLSTEITKLEKTIAKIKEIL